MVQEKLFPGSFPHTKDSTDKRLVLFKKKKLLSADHSLIVNAKQAPLQKFKLFFGKKQKITERNGASTKEIAKWRQWFRPSFFSKKEQALHQLTLSKKEQNNKIGSIISVGVPISISSTTNNHYYGSSANTMQGKPSSISTSIVQQMVILPPFQVYGFMLIVTLLLLVIAFAILQLHRTITIIDTLLAGVSYTLVGLASTSASIATYFKSFFFNR